MSRKPYKILTDIDLSRNSLLNVTEIKSPGTEGLSKDLEISADKGSINVKVTPQDNESISLQVGENSNLKLSSNEIKANSSNIALSGSNKVESLLNGGNTSITLQKKKAEEESGVKEEIDIASEDVNISASKKFKLANNAESITLDPSNIESTFNVKATRYVHTSSESTKITAEKALNVSAGKDPIINSYSYILNVESKNDNSFESTETVDNLTVRKTQDFKGSKFTLNSQEVNLKGKDSFSLTGPMDSGLEITASKAKTGSDGNIEKGATSSIKSKSAAFDSLDATNKITLGSGGEFSATYSDSENIRIVSPNLELRSSDTAGTSPILSIKTPAEEEISTTLNVDKATINKSLTSSGLTTLSGNTDINGGTLEVSANTSTIDGNILNLNSSTINIGDSSETSELTLTAANLIEKVTDTTEITTSTFKHTVEGDYDLHNKDNTFKIYNDSAANTSSVKADKVYANKALYAGRSTQGLKIFWDETTSSIVFSGWGVND